MKSSARFEGCDEDGSSSDRPAQRDAVGNWMNGHLRCFLAGLVSATLHPTWASAALTTEKSNTGVESQARNAIGLASVEQHPTRPSTAPTAGT